VTPTDSDQGQPNRARHACETLSESVHDMDRVRSRASTSTICMLNTSLMGWSPEHAGLHHSGILPALHQSCDALHRFMSDLQEPGILRFPADLTTSPVKTNQLSVLYQTVTSFTKHCIPSGNTEVFRTCTSSSRNRSPRPSSDPKFVEQGSLPHLPTGHSVRCHLK
jgi:hypothetical protein